MKQLTKFEYVLLKLVSANEGISWYGLGTSLSRIDLDRTDRGMDMMACLGYLADENLLYRTESDIAGMDMWFTTENGLEAISDFEESNTKTKD